MRSGFAKSCVEEALMPLLDRFHPPLSQRRHWESFHSTWATTLADALNQDWLPEGYFAEEVITVGGRVEIDVATFEEPTQTAASKNGGVATITKKTWTPPAPDLTMPGVFPDTFAVQVYSSEGGPTLVGSIELVSPGNKDRDTHRQAFAIKCANYLHQGVGVVIIDIVTSRHANLHNELVALLRQPAEYRMTDDAFLYVTAYRPATREERSEIDIWRRPLSLGQELPAMPLALKGASTVKLELESTYDSVCRRRL
jgi:hypothetical protein